MSRLLSSLALLCLVTFMVYSGVSAQHTASDKSYGLVHCFSQGLASALARLQLNNNYICTLNSQIGPLPGFDFSVFGPHHGFPIIQAEEPYFFETYYGTPDDGYVAINRVNTTEYSALGYYMFNDTLRVAYYLDNQGELTSQLFGTSTTYRATQRPWYQGALNSATGSFVTSTPFTFSLTSLRVGSSKQCKNSGGTLDIIAGSGLTLETLTAMALTSTSCPLFSKTAGTVFVVNSDGILLMANDAIVSSIYPAKNSTGLVQAAAENVEALNGGDWSQQVSGLFQYNNEEYESLTYQVTGLAGSHVDVSVWGWTVVTATKTSSSGSSASAVRNWF